MFPKEIHQIWFDFNNGVEIDDERLELMNMNKMESLKHNYKHQMWSLTQATEFVEKHYPYYISFLKKKWTHNIIKCDFFRYLLMYHFGGLYVDLDFVLTPNFIKMYEDYDDYEIVLFEEWYNSVNLENSISSKGSLHNGFLLSKPKNEFWLKMMNKLVTSAPLIHNKQDVWKLSGTNLLRNMYVKEKDITIYHCPYYRVCAFKCVDKDNLVIECMNEKARPLSLSQSSWRFFSLDDYKNNVQTFSECYGVCIGVKHGSLWVT